MRKLPRIPWRVIRATLTSPKLWAGTRRAIVRLYAGAILAVLVVFGFLALKYLVRTVFFPPPTPLEVEAWPASLDISVLRADSQPGVEKAAPRTPLSHFHQLDQWFQPDSFNGCTVPGCHQPLPHDSRSKVPAFANFHTTFLACQMCHRPSSTHPGDVRWINTQTGRPQATPAILQLLNLLETESSAIEDNPASVQARLTRLLSQAITDHGGDDALDQLLAEIQSSEPGSPVWKQAVGDLAGELPQYARGEYRAKLIWSDLADDESARFDRATAQASQLAAAGSDDQRSGIIKVVHSPLASAPAPCLACHDDQPGMVDFAGAGFSPKRAQYLSSLEIARLMQRIRQGEQFYLPNLELGQ